MNTLSNTALQQLDETVLYTPIDPLRSAIVTQDTIDAGVREGRLLRSRAFHQAVWKLMALLNGSGGAR
tara:strand:+ start:483 stop:686 length:204 start_codon:yes stop_codon:yes gene_type:complete